VPNQLPADRDWRGRYSRPCSKVTSVTIRFISRSVRPNVVSAISGRIRCRVMALGRENSRSPSAPWIRPNPDSPTPPNGSAGTIANPSTELIEVIPDRNERAAAIAAEVRSGSYDLVLLGNEAADTGDYQVGVRLAHELGWPVATGIKNLSLADGGVVARREYRGVEEAYSLPLPAVVTVKEGINLPRYPSLPGRLRAKRAAVDRSSPEWAAEGLRKSALRVPESGKHQAEVLGEGVDAVPSLVRVLEEWGVLS